MAMAIAHNINAIGVQRTLNQSNASLSGSLQKLSTGYRINVGKDDPSGLVISELLRSQTNGIARAVQNTQEANNVLGIAEGALNEMNNILTKMRQLAIHAANNGITSSDQVAADQSEIDSSIQTLDRIARTTTYTSDNLLNGNKKINYDTSVLVKDTKDMALIDKGLTNIEQIFKRADFQLNINFSGKDADGLDNQNAAKKAYFEITTQAKGAEATQVNNSQYGAESYTLTKDQAFTVSGVNGSRYMTFAKGTHLGEMVTAINSVSDSTGVKANLIFDAGVLAHEPFTNGATDVTSQVVSDAGSGIPPIGSGGNAIRAFNIDRSGKILGYDFGVTQIDCSSMVTSSYYNTDTGEIISASMFNKLSAAQQTGFATDGALFQIGTNLDGLGRMYLKMVTDDKYEIYKDPSMTMRVGYGAVDSAGGTSAVNAVNDSGIAGMQLSFGTDMSKFLAGSTTVLQFGSMAMDKNATDGVSAVTDGGLTEPVNFKGLADALGSIGGTDVNFSYFSGVQLGVNTSENGKLYIKADIDPNGGVGSQIWVFRDKQMRDEDLVARSDKFDATAGAQSVSIFAERIGDTVLDTGLYGVINIGDASVLTNPLKVEGAIVSFENLGARLSSAEYGADQFIKITQAQGAVWSRYDTSNIANVIDAGVSGAEWTNYGRNAILALNGQKVTLQGITGTLANLDSTANIAFKAGAVGNTTLASTGYTDGTLATKAAVYGNTRNQEVNALHSTTEIIKNFTGGMQFQLGEGAGDQNRTIYSIQDITAPFLGKMKFHDYFGNNFKSDRYLSIQDMMSGGPASLAVDSVKSMAIVTKAIRDVSTMRANIGAFQANMLQSNANNLNVAFEKISETESYIRDTDMATESTLFTKNQVLVQAGTSMLAQANQLTQTALSLIGG